MEGSAVNGLPLAVVETKDGLFLGVITEKNPGGLSAITWEQALADKTQPYIIKPKLKKPLKPGTTVFALFDSGTRTQRKVASDNPHDFIVYPESYSEILSKGPWTLKTSFLIPKDSGFEPLKTVESQSSYSFEIERKLDRILLTFEALAGENTRFLITSDLEKREIQRSISAIGVQSIQAKPWRKYKEQLNAELKLLTDGAIRFTDGELIYEITMGKFSPELALYTIEKNTLADPKKSALR